MWYSGCLLLFSFVCLYGQQCSDWTNGVYGTYAVFCERRNSPGAQAACEEHGANLVSIHSKEERDWVFKFVRDHGVGLKEYESEFAIVGLRMDLHDRNHIYWTDRTPYDYVDYKFQEEAASDDTECAFMEIPSLEWPPTPDYDPYDHIGFVPKHCRDTSNIFVCKRKGWTRPW